MASSKLSRRNMLQASAASVAAAGLVDRLLDPTSAWAQSGRPLRVRADRTVSSTDPGYMIGGYEMFLQYACMARLAKYTNSLTSWDWEPSEFVESLGQPDPQTITFELKKGIMWYDGTSHEVIGELNAEDVKFSLERMQVSEWKDKAVSLDHVEVTGSHTGIIHLNQPFAPIWLTWLCDGTGSILSKVAVEAVGGKFDGLFNFYCGPYRVSEWVLKQSISLEPNPNWGGTPPGIENVQLIIIAEEKTAEIAFEAGEIDIRVRRAIQHAVDVDTVLEGAWAGVGTRAYGIVPPGLIGHRTEGKYMEQDLDAARALMAEAGAEGLKVTLKTMNLQDRLAAATIIQANLAEIGIEVEVVPVDAGPFWNLGLEAEGEEWRDLELWIMAYLDSPDPSQMAQWFISDQVGVWNWERWSDPEFDELYAAGLAEIDTAKRHDMYIRMQEIMEDTGAYVWLMFPPRGVLYREGLDPVITPNGYIWQLQSFMWSEA